MNDLNPTQLRGALRAALELAEVRDMAEFPVRCTHLLRGLIACEHASYNAINVATGRTIVVADPPEIVFAGGEEVFAALADQNPMVGRAREGDPRALRLSDHITRRQLHRTELYGHVYRLIDVEYQLATPLTLPRSASSNPAEIVGLSLCRTHHDFSDAELQLLDLLRPLLAATATRLHELAVLRALIDGEDRRTGRWVMLIDAHATLTWATPAASQGLTLTIGEPIPGALRQWVTADRHGTAHPPTNTVIIDGTRLNVRRTPDAYPGLDALYLRPPPQSHHPTALSRLGLTRRQAQVMALALHGHTSREIAHQLTLSPRTVESHLDAIYDRLGVRNRTEAILAVTSAIELP